MSYVCLVMNQCDTVSKFTYVHKGCLQSLRDLYGLETWGWLLRLSCVVRLLVDPIG